MDYAEPELNRRLAAEYALGTLRGSARRRFERLLTAHPDMRAEVGFWEARLCEFGAPAEPIAPPPQARIQLRAFIEREQLAAAASMPMPMPKFAKPAVRFAFSRKAWAGLAAAAALLLAFGIGQRHPLATHSISHGMLVAKSRAGDQAVLPMYVTSLKLPASSMRWLISISPDRRQLTVDAADDYTQLGRYSVELWWVSPTHGLLPLGLLPSARDATASIAVPKDFAQQPQISFMISLEPQGGSPTGSPTGPELDTQPDLGAI